MAKICVVILVISETGLKKISYGFLKFLKKTL